MSKKEKRDKKREAFLSKLAPVKKIKPKKSTTLNVDSLQQSMLEILNEEPKPKIVKNRISTGRGRKHVLKTELQHMKQIYKHPIFKADSLSAIQQHVQNTAKLME